MSFPYNLSSCIYASGPETSFAGYGDPAQQPLKASSHVYGKRKRFRTAFRTDQIEDLERHFQKKKYLDRETRMCLAQKFNVNERIIKVWFQNRRMKEKKDKLECQQTEECSSSTHPIMGSDNQCPYQVQPNNYHVGQSDGNAYGCYRNWPSTSHPGIPDFVPQHVEYGVYHSMFPNKNQPTYDPVPYVNIPQMQHEHLPTSNQPYIHQEYLSNTQELQPCVKNENYIPSLEDLDLLNSILKVDL